MSPQYITDDDGHVVAQFDGREREPKDGHESHIVASIDDLPGVDEWDSDYIDR